MEIHLLKLGVSNAYLLNGRRPILVDTGSKNDFELLRNKLAKIDTALGDLALIVHTHVHSDHVGSTAQLATEAKCPIAYHSGDHELAVRGDNGSLNGVGLRGKIMSPFFSHSKFAPVAPDMALEDGMDLSTFGCDARIISTPGHTAGSISVILPNGDAIIGDVIMGGYIGGNVFPTKPNQHYFAADLEQSMASLDRILEMTSGDLYVGHGGPLRHRDVKAWRRRQTQG